MINKIFFNNNDIGSYKEFDRRMKRKILISNMLKFFPLLIIYIAIVIIFSKESFCGDERRYVVFASNLTKGYYSPVGQVYLWNGPGYPIILMPFVSFKIPWLIPKLMNAVFLFFAILIFYHTLKLYLTEQHATLVAFLMGLYPPFMRYLHMLITEVFTIFLVCGFLFYLCKLYQSDKIRWNLLLICAGFLGYLALTKIFFGYVILCGLLLYGILYISKRKQNFKKSLLVYLFALTFCLPYLIYTYSLTGKIFYWGQAGGMSLYWMSSPYKNDLGDWHDFKAVKSRPELAKNHLKFFEELKRLSFTEKDDRFKKRAIENIINNPLKFLKNWLANIGRLLFNYPYSYTPQKLSTYFYIIPNMFLVVFSILCIYPTYKGRKLIPFEIHSLLLFTLISFGGSSLLSAYNRQLWPLVPILFLWMSFVFVKILRLEIRQ